MNILVIHSSLGLCQGRSEEFTRRIFAEIVNHGHTITAMFAADVHGRFPCPMPVGFRTLPVIGWWPSRGKRGVFSSKLMGAYGSNSIRSPVELLRQSYCRIVRSSNRLRFRQRVRRALPRYIRSFDVFYVHSDTQLAYSVAEFRPTLLRVTGPIAPRHRRLSPQLGLICTNGQTLRAAATISADAVHDVPVGVDVQLFKPGESTVRRGLAWDGQCFVIGVVGNCSDAAAVRALVSFVKFMRQCMPEARMLVVTHGQINCSIYTELAREIEQALVRIEVESVRNRLADTYRAMDLLVVMNDVECYSFNVLEAIACGVPALIPKSGVDYFLLPNKSIFEYSFATINSLGIHIKNLSRDRLLIKTRGEVARQFVHTRSSWVHAAESIEKLLLSFGTSPAQNG